MFEIGDTLREARNRKGLTLRDVEDSTKIRSRYLQALENDDFEVIPGPTFVKGFLRTYATHLGLDADLLVGEYRSRFDHPPDAHPLLAARPQRQQTRGAERRRPNTRLIGVMAILIIVVLAWVGWGNKLGGKADMGAGATTTSIQNTSTSGSTTTTTAANTTSTIAAEGGKVRLVVSVTKDRCFLTVRQESSAGKELFSGTLNQGDSVTYADQEKFWLNVGNPSAIQVTINGKSVPVPEPYGYFLVTSAGLSRVQ